MGAISGGQAQAPGVWIGVCRLERFCPDRRVAPCASH